MSGKEEDRAFQLECILEVNRSLEVLGKVECEDYSNRQKNYAAYDIFIIKFQE